MSKKFDGFMKDLEELCVKHNVDMWPDGQDLIWVADLPPGKLTLCANHDFFVDDTNGDDNA